MSIFSDHKCGAISDDEFRSACARMNAQDREERECLERDGEEQEGVCLTCKHWKDVHLRKRYIASHPQYWHDRDGNRQSDERIQVLYITQSDKDYETTAVCDKDMVETYEDYCCEDYEAEGEECDRS